MVVAVKAVRGKMGGKDYWAVYGCDNNRAKKDW